ncbi:MAG: DUF5615 family PIN-like protein [Chloroflexota bacterium]
MRFKIDENLPVEAADALHSAGHDAETVHAENLTGETDENIANICQKENRAIITLDLGFADIQAYPPKNFAGLIVLRLSRQDKSHVSGVVQKIASAFTKENPRGKLWIVEEKRIRVRS